MKNLPFSKSDLAAAKQLIAKKKVGAILFSEGTYQVEIFDLKTNKKSHWPFLQMDDEGNIQDAFCNCKTAEKKGACQHLAAAYLRIVKEKRPLHVRFRGSLWNVLCELASRKLGYDTHSISKIDGGGFQAKSTTDKQLFYIKPLKEAGKKRLNDIFITRPLETEETSLKFSNLSQEEIALWRQGRPSHQLRYELSFWSDLAKWLMDLQEKEMKYTIHFSKEDEQTELPHWITIRFPDVEVGFYLAEVSWQETIPALSMVNSPLAVHAYRHKTIKKIEYDPEEIKFRIEHQEKKEQKTDEILKNAIEVDGWLFVANDGFYPRENDPIFQKDSIGQNQIEKFLDGYQQLAQKHLVEYKIHPGPISARYFFDFDENGNLNIHCYLFEPGDLEKPLSAYFGNWVFIEGKGFFRLENQLFSGKQKTIPKEKVSEFINEHRVMLAAYEGFQTHVSGIESRISYRVGKDNTLEFYSHLETLEEEEEILDLDEWIYVKGKGFYAKAAMRPGLVVTPGLKIQEREVSHFIQTHREELELITGFFSAKCPLKKVGLELSFNEEGQIKVSPKYFFAPGYSEERVKLFGDFTYVKKEGFFSIPQELRLPDHYRKDVVIDRDSELYFLGCELDLLYPYIIAIDPKLIRPKSLSLRLSQIKRDEASKTGEWILDLSYETDIGHVDIHQIWEGLCTNKHSLFTDAGLIFLREARFNWLKKITKKQWLQKGKKVRFNTLEWLRLTAFEEVKEPKGDSKTAEESRKILHAFQAFKAPDPMNLDGLKSDLRTYQVTGVHWLWFLYCYGLSGLLCDEMGLGKTHQAMALIAASKNAKKDQSPKYLVVCPTSVVYHWEELCKRFLPDVRVHLFHGIMRKNELVKEGNYDLLLTTYGIVRSDLKLFSSLYFEIAIYDEIQTAKNIHSQTNRSLRALHARMRLGLTGTPIENQLLELKALFDVVLPTYLPVESLFKELFVHPIEKYHDDQKRQLLARLIRPFVLKRRKKEVLTELPEKFEEIIYCDLSEEQKNMYNALVQAYQVPLLEQLEDEKKAIPLIHIFALFSKLKQVCDHPSLITKDIQDYKRHHSGKWDLFIELLNETRDSGQKLVVFSQFLDMLAIMEDYLTEHGIGFASIKGSTKDRKAEVHKFKDDPKCEVFLGSLQAAGVGIDLVAASVVIHYDRWWNPAKENQATDRVHRIGQNRGVQVFKMVTKNTIEEHIHWLIEKKMGLMEGIIGFDEQDHIKGLSRPELVELIKLMSVQ
ncbi:MAG TPA: DEAD/DEAH box helicase [Rhabdochlamydiaceae bacterium]|nr:DEAD/DEAH box helicase [Rhabdochlamydiaceae bacterium]